MRPATDTAGSQSPGWFSRLDIDSRFILLILAVSLVKGIIYALIVPAFQGADESTYFLGLQHWAARLFPTLAPKPIGPPISSGLLTRAIYLPAYLAAAPAGTYVQLLALRLVSVGLAVATVYVIYLAAKSLAPDDRFIVLGAPLFVALIPQYSHVSGTFNFDSAATLAASIFLLFGIRLIRYGFRVPLVAGAAVSAAAAVLAKQTAFFVVPTALLLPAAIILRARPEPDAVRRRNQMLAAWAVALVFLVPLGGWVSQHLTEATLTAERVRQVLSPSGLLSTFSVLAAPTNILLRSFWADAGWLTVPMSDNYYRVLATSGLLAVAGVVLYLLRAVTGADAVPRWQTVTVVFLGGAMILELAIVLSRQQLIAPGFGAQGRWVFPALVSISILTMLGWRQLLWMSRAGRALVAIAMNMFVLDMVFQWGYVVRLYYDSFPTIIQKQSLNFGPALASDVGAKIATKQPFLLTQPATYAILFALYLAALAYFCWLALEEP